MKRLIIFGWIFSIISLFLYSYTQVDLSLTLSQASIYQTIEKGFQYIGWFNRPLSTYLYSGVLVLLFSFYGFLLYAIYKGILERKTIWQLVIFTTLVLAFSYNAFSYDLFNYIFDAKIITHYGQNPYEHKALDYAGEPLLSFMRWTHRTYPYGPFWLVLTVPLSFIGMNIFSITFFLFKLFIAASFLITCYCLEKITNVVKPKEPTVTRHLSPFFRFAVFAFNPFILIEGLVSAHIDIVMYAFLAVALYWFLEKKYISSAVAFILSAAIKFATIFFLPSILYVIINKLRRKEIKTITFFKLGIMSSILSIFASTWWSGNFQPWYVIPAIFFLSIYCFSFWQVGIVTLLSLVLVTTYIPVLYYGNWDIPVLQIQTTIYWIGAILATIIWIIKKKRNSVQKQT